MQIGVKHLNLNFECVQNICNTKNNVILSNSKEKWSYERLSIVRQWVGREGFCYHFGKLHVSVSAVGDRSISCWEDDGIKRPLFTRWSRPKRWRRCQRWYHWWYSWGAWMVTKRRRLCKTGVIRKAGGLNFLFTTCKFFTQARDVFRWLMWAAATCHLTLKIVQSVVVQGRRKILGLDFSLTSTPFSHHMASYCPVGWDDFETKGNPKCHLCVLTNLNVSTNRARSSPSFVLSTSAVQSCALLAKKMLRSTIWSVRAFIRLHVCL